MIIDDTEWAALAAHLESLEAQIAELSSQVDFLARERLLYKEGRDALERTTNPSVDLLAPLPAGFGRGNAGQVVGLTYAAAQEMEPDWFRPSPRKRAKKADGSSLD